MNFKDHFSEHAANYAQFRPLYPPELFEYLGSIAPNRALAWDCATGNGQAACELGESFARVIATDASEKQIANSTKHARVEYRLAPAEASGLEANSVSLITVAQALHWFVLAKFFGEAERVLQTRGVLAVWTYNLFRVTPEIDALVETFYRETVGPYWDFERTLVETGYRTVDFPLAKIEPPDFQMTANWSLDQALGYLRTWSATKAFIKRHGFDPVDSLGEKFRELWPSSGRVDWPLSLIVRQKQEGAGLATHPFQLPSEASP